MTYTDESTLNWRVYFNLRRCTVQSLYFSPNSQLIYRHEGNLTFGFTVTVKTYWLIEWQEKAFGSMNEQQESFPDIYKLDLWTYSLYIYQVTALFVLAGVLCLAYTAWAEPAAEPEALALAMAGPEPLAYPGSSSSGGKWVFVEIFFEVWIS